MNDPQDPVRQALAGYAAAVRVKDLDAFLALYAEDAHVFDLWGRWSLRGIAAWRDMAQGWFSSLGDEWVAVEAADIESVREDGLAIGHATLTYTAYSAEGAALRSLDNRITLGMRRGAQGWKIFHEHTSAPVAHASMKAILRRVEAAAPG